MSDNLEALRAARPDFPKRAIITAGMPYGNKDLHFGHIGGVFIYADIYKRFLQDRLGRDQVIFVSGTDGFGSPIVESHQKLKDTGEFDGDLQDFVLENHKLQKEMLDAYDIDISLFAASSFGRSREVHEQVCADLIKTLHAHGHLRKLTTKQFYDPEFDSFLNGRQVTGKCPILNCPSEKAYADECSLGHQYMPNELEFPKSTLSGKRPEMRDVTNWFIDLASFRQPMTEWADGLLNGTKNRAFYVKNIAEFFEPPIIHVKRDQQELLETLTDSLPHYELQDGQTKAIRLVFKSLEDREKACEVLTGAGVRYRTGKTLVPFRLTGNIDWGLPVPEMEGLGGLTWWVWPESLIAPISFTATYLEAKGESLEAWRDWWCDSDTKVYQFIGEDNIYFYGVAEIAMFLGLQSESMAEIKAKPPSGQLQLPELVVNNHLLFLDKKASSSGKVKPPMARDLLAYYTSDQLRAHFFALGLGLRSVSFRPKPLNPKATEKDGDPVLKEGNLLSNVFNRLARSCFYTAQSYSEGRIPLGTISQEVKDAADEVILKFEACMASQEFHLAIALLDKYIREASKSWTKGSKAADEANDERLRAQVLIDSFHAVRVASVLMHPIAPKGCEMIREYFQLDDSFWDWQYIFEPVYGLMSNPATHQLKELAPRVDFFEKHPSQIKS